MYLSQGKYTLNSDATISNTLEINEDSYVTIELDGHTLTVNNFLINQGATLNVYDSSGNGKIISNDSLSGIVIHSKNTKKATINWYSGDYAAPNGYGFIDNSMYNSDGGTTINIYGGKFNTKRRLYISSFNAHLSIYGGEFTVTNDPFVTISNEALNEDSSIYIDNVTIDFNYTDFILYAVKAKVTIGKDCKLINSGGPVCKFTSCEVDLKGTIECKKTGNNITKSTGKATAIYIVNYPDTIINLYKTAVIKSTHIGVLFGYSTRGAYAPFTFSLGVVDTYSTYTDDDVLTINDILTPEEILFYDLGNYNPIENDNYVYTIDTRCLLVLSLKAFDTVFISYSGTVTDDTTFIVMYEALPFVTGTSSEMYYVTQSGGTDLDGFTALLDGDYYILIDLCDDDTDDFTGTIELFKIGGIGLSEISGKTTNKCECTPKNTYACKATYNDGVEQFTLTSNPIYYDPYYITYDINTGTGSVVDSTKYKKNQEVTISSIGDAYKTNNSFIGWCKDADGSSTLYQSGDKITIAEDITLYAIWSNKTVVTITETVQSYTYDGSEHGFVITSSVSTGFNVEYKVNNVWTSSKPVNAGKYDVKVTRAEDSTYASFNRIITDGLVIARAQVNKPTADNRTFTYNGSDQTYILSINALYTISDNITKKNAGTYNIVVSLNDKTNYEWNDRTCDNLQFNFVINKQQVNKPTADNRTFTFNGNEQTYVLTTNDLYTISDNLTNTFAGTYNIVVSLNDSSNYEWNDSTIDNLLFDFIINKKVVTISWCSNYYLFNNTVQSIKASYKDINNNDVELNVTTPTPFKDAGTYIATASFKNNETNYELPVSCSKSYTISELKQELSEKTITEETLKVEDGTKVEIIAGSLNVSAVVVIKKDVSDLSETVKESVKTVVSKKSEVIAKFEIHLEDQNGITITNIDGNKYKVTIVLPDELLNKKGYNIVYIKDDGTVEKYDSVISDNTIEFETSHFSTWGIVANKQSLSWFGTILIVLFALILIFVGMFIIWKAEYTKAFDNNTLEDRKLKFCDVVFKPIDKMIFKK